MFFFQNITPQPQPLHSYPVEIVVNQNMSIESSENEEVIIDPGSECVSDDSRVEQHSSAVFTSTESEGENDASFHSFATYVLLNILCYRYPLELL